MFASQSDSLTHRAHRLLRPENALIRLRAIKLAHVGGAIEPHFYRVAALNLYCRFYPHLLLDILPEPEWAEVFRYFISMVQTDRGIEIDWETLAFLYRCAHEDYPEDEDEADDRDWESDYMEKIATALTAIPVKCFGFNQDDDIMGLEFEEFPVMMLLNVLLKESDWQDSWKLPSHDGFRFLRPVGEWGNDEARLAWETVNALDTGALAEPLCWLPEMARYACAQTGNPLVDNPAGFAKWERADWYTWDQLDEVCRLWPAAKAAADRMETFSSWANHENNLKQVAKLVIGSEL